ncbi:MAG: PTS sugar transporter subunit IIA [bacterium]
MKIVDFLTPKDILQDLSAGNLEDVLRELSSHLADMKKIENSEALVQVLVEREKLGSTGIGHGVAIPHGRLAGLERILIVFGRSKKGIDFDSADGQPVYLFFLLVAPEDSAGEHLKALARISRIIKNKVCREELLNASGVEMLYKTISKEDSQC